MAKVVAVNALRFAVVTIVLAMMTTALSAAVSTPAASAAAQLCSDEPGNGYRGIGPDCTGEDPEKHCADDAITAASMAITTELGYAGQLELRYSPSCKAN